MASNYPMTGGYDCKFVETPPDKLMCQICLLMARIPHQVTCCGRVYCKACLNEHKRHSFTCPNCRKSGRSFPDVRGEQEIKALKVKCSNGENGCSWMGELQSLENHLTTCEYVLLRCTNKCTNNTEEVYVLRCDLDDHLKHKCPNRQYQCPHCKEIGRHCEMTTTHLDTCPCLEVICPNAQCNASVLRSELSDHRTKCLFEEVPCKYAEIGCEEEPLRKDLEQHENNDTFHLHLAIETINAQQEEMDAIIEEQRAMNVQLRAITSLIGANIARTQASPCVFKMPMFNQQKTLDESWYSSSFYIHPGSYKMCIYVDANGGGEFEGTHISVYACLMRGKNDDNLSWPFRGEVTITLLNQLEDKNHYRRTVVYPRDLDSESNRRVMDRYVGQGYGWPDFISNDRLGYDAEQNCQYLKEDCLYFQIKAKAPHAVKPWLTCTT